MKIAFIDIRNFRKLKNCRIELSDEKTVFVGANNSGKTSAMDALIQFLGEKGKKITTNEFTLSNWKSINQIAENWINPKAGQTPDLSAELWYKLVPSLDVWLDIDVKEIQYISDIIPTIKWRGGELGIRLMYEPENTEELYKSYKVAYESAKTTASGHASLELWPKSMRDFLDKKQILNKQFKMNAYILDPLKAGNSHSQDLPANAEPLEHYPFNDLFKIDMISAQRGFSDPNSENEAEDSKSLSVQLRKYYEKHLNPSELPDKKDLDALESIENARKEFDIRLMESFEISIGELEDLNYPGISDPKIHMASKFDPVEGLKHDAAIQFEFTHDESQPIDISMCLPEKYNGLGYQNLISMVFNLIRFRDEWMKVGKLGKRPTESEQIVPIHLVLIEEPEAHLHAQVQQVFVKKSYSVLRKHPDLGDKIDFTTQLVISTHSSHIAHEIDFVSLRYFKRIPATIKGDVPCSEVINLSTVFGDESNTSKFSTRYLKTTHCDLFFADAVILIEGPAEKMLVPYFIKNGFEKLNRCYVSILEIGGSHAHRLEPLIETLGIFTLVVTDIDSVEKKEEKNEETGKIKTTYPKVLPERGRGYLTGNDTLKTWIPQIKKLDDLFEAKESKKIKDGFIRVAYQTEIDLKFNGKDVKAIPYTFEDALVLSNLDYFGPLNDVKGLIKKMSSALKLSTINDACDKMYNALTENSKKAEMALELLFRSDPGELNTPSYIAEGLQWLEDELTKNNVDYLIEEADSQEGKENE